MQVLRSTFFLLVLGNLLLFAWGQGYFGPRSVGGEAERLTAQIAPDKLRVVSRGVPPLRLPQPAREECRAFAGLADSDAQILVALIGARDADLKVARRPLTEPRSWWVYIPPLPNGAQADKKAAELSKLRIKDFYVVREDGPNQYALSLGLFKSEEGARDYLDSLAKKGVKSARIQVRESPGDRVLVEARGPAERLNKALADLPAELNAPAPGDCPPATP